MENVIYNPNKIGKQSRSETARIIRNQQHNDVKGRGVGLHGDGLLDSPRTWNNYYCLMIGNNLTTIQKVMKMEYDISFRFDNLINYFNEHKHDENIRTYIKEDTKSKTRITIYKSGDENPDVLVCVEYKGMDVYLNNPVYSSVEVDKFRISNGNSFIEFPLKIAEKLI